MSKAKEMLGILAQEGLTLGSVESLTGGLFAATVCEVPGASRVFSGALVTYDPRLKSELAYVNEASIKLKGVVSADVAVQMAEGGAKRMGVDVCVSCTGNAGPTTEPGGEPVGRVFLGLSYNGYSWTVPLLLEGDRQKIREQTVENMMDLVISLFTVHNNS
ncbi:MAG: CinA family protein [Bacilli bacterium]|nr:CinA family protein [Bacilli bacterium]